MGLWQFLHRPDIRRKRHDLSVGEVPGARRGDRLSDQRDAVHDGNPADRGLVQPRKGSEEHTSELQSLMRISYAVFCLKKKRKHIHNKNDTTSYTHNDNI